MFLCFYAVNSDIVNVIQDYKISDLPFPMLPTAVLQITALHTRHHLAVLSSAPM